MLVALMKRNATYKLPEEYQQIVYKIVRAFEK
jgi:hypothetical protein